MMSDEDEGSADRRVIHTVSDEEDCERLSTNPSVSNLAGGSDNEDDASMILPTPKKLPISSKVSLLDAHKSKLEKCSFLKKFRVQKDFKVDDDDRVGRSEPVHVLFKEPKPGQSADVSDFKSASPQQHSSADFAQPKVPDVASQETEDDGWNLHLSSSLIGTYTTQEECSESKKTDNIKVSPPLLLQEIFSNVASSQNSRNGDSEPDLPPTQRNPDLFTDSINNSDFSDEDEIAPSQEPTQPMISIHDHSSPIGKKFLKSRSPLTRIRKTVKDELMEISESCNISDTVDLTEVPETQEIELQYDPGVKELTENRNITELQETNYIVEDDRSVPAAKDGHDGEEEDNHIVAVAEVGHDVSENKDNFSVAAVEQGHSIATVKKGHGIAENIDDRSVAIADHAVAEDENHNIAVMDVDSSDKVRSIGEKEEPSVAELQGSVEQQEVKELPETVALIQLPEIMQKDELLGTLEMNELQKSLEENQMSELIELQEIEKKKDEENKLVETVVKKKTDELNKLEETTENKTLDKESVEINKVGEVNKLYETVEKNKIGEVSKLPGTLETNKMDELSDLPETEQMSRVDGLKEFQDTVEKSKMNEINESQEAIEINKMDELPETVLLETNNEYSSVGLVEENSSKKGVDEKVQVLMFPLPGIVKKMKHFNESSKELPGASMCDTSSPNYMSTMLKEVPFIESTDSTCNVPVHAVGTFTGPNDLNVLLKSLGLSADDDKLESFSSQSGDSREHVIFRGMATYKVVIKNKTVFQKFVPLGHSKVIGNLSEVEVSPVDSSSTTSSAKISSFGSTPSGELGDISCSISSKSSSSQSHSSISVSQSNIRKSVLLQEAPMDTLAVKTSTQKSCAAPVSFKSPGIFDASESDINKRNQEAGLLGHDTLSKFHSDDKIFRSPSVVLPHIKDLHYCPPLKSGVVSSKLKRGRKRKEQKNLSSSISNSDSYEKPAKRPRDEKSDTDQNSSSPISIPTPSKNFDFPKRTVHGLRKKSTNKSITTGKKSDSYKDSVEVSDDSFNSETDSAPFGIILPGVRVMARWKDGYYYPAVVKSQESEGRWWIHFDDGSLRNVTEKNLLKISILQVGTSVLAQTSPDGFYDPGTVKSHFREDTQYGYVIEHETGLTKRYSRSAVILSTDQAKIITGIRPVAPPSSTINLENIIGGKRKRKSASESEKGMEKDDSNLEATESSMSESVLPEKNIVEKVKSQLKKGVRQKSTRPKASRRRGPTSHVVHGKISTSSDISSDISDNKEMSDLKIRKSKIFMGYAFILSNAVRSPTVKGEIDSCDDSELAESYDERQPFDKEYLCKEILAGGGIVLETFEEALKSKRKVFLLASTYLRTIKYIRCVAVNIPCIKHYWIYNCCFTKILQDHHPYLLPTGYSIIENVIVEWHNKTNIFKGMKVVLTAEKKSDFVSIWTPVLLSANADLVQKWNLPSFSTPGMSFPVDLIITNASCPSNIITAAKRRKMPIVSSEWMIQSIIAGNLLAYDAHPKFKHDYKA